MKVAIDSDDAGLELKRVIAEHLRTLDVEFEDLHLLGEKKVDYPDVAYRLSHCVAKGDFDRGILICGTGLGMCMVANKVEGIYAGVCHDVYSAERLRKSNDAQILTMGARVVGPELAKSVVTAWLKSEFEPGRSDSKVARMRELERLDRRLSSEAKNR